MTKKQYSKLEGHRRHGEEVQCGDHFAVILEKSQPPLTRIATPPQASPIPCHTPLGDDEAEFLQFAVDLGRSPVWVFIG